MHFSLGHSMVVAALVSSIFLVLNFGERLFPLIALVASGIEALMIFGIITISTSIRLAVILPATMLIAGAICWSRGGEKSTTTAATVLTLVALIQLLAALSIMNN